MLCVLICGFSGPYEEAGLEKDHEALSKTLGLEKEHEALSKTLGERESEGAGGYLQDCDCSPRNDSTAVSQNWQFK